jgi:hypothetical protein
MGNKVQIYQDLPLFLYISVVSAFSVLTLFRQTGFPRVLKTATKRLRATALDLITYQIWTPFVLL